MDRSMRKKKPLLQHHHRIKIPEEIVMDEILPRLPVKSLLRFRCVSKPWLSLIDSDRFIKTHLQNSTQNPDYSHWRVVFNSESGLKQSSMRDYFDEESQNLPPIDDPTIDEEMATAEIVGSCNGVVCLFNHAGGRFFLWNPATRNHTKLPRVECATSELGFGWDERSCAFKVFVVVRSDDEEYRHIGMVYNSETESWKKTADYEYMFLLFGTGKFASGKIHWMTYSKHWNIEFFDLRREVFGRIELPKPCNPTVFVCPLMWETMGCLGLILDSYDDDHGIRRRVWVMKDEGCWVEVAKEPCLELISEPGKGILVQSLVSPRRRRRINESSSY